MRSENQVSFFRCCSSKLFWLKETWQHPRINDLWGKVMRIEESSRDELLQVVNEKLQRVLRHTAKTVPYYRAYFSKKGLSPDNLRIEDFPILEKKDIRGHEEEFVSSDWMGRKIGWTRTSGSTGEPFRFGRTEYEYPYTTLWRGLSRFGIRPGDRRVLVKGVDETSRVSWKTRFRRKIYGWINRCIVVDAHFLAKSEANIAAELNRIVSYRPQYFHGYASSIHLLAQYAERHGIDLAALKVKAVVTESEKCHDFQRELIERVFKAPVVENYGCVEFGMIAQPAKDGVLCISEDHVYVETTDDGEAVFTNLDEYGFPLIRFKNGDLIKLGAAHAQLPYRTISELDGRKTEMIILPQGGALHGFIPMYPVSKHSMWMRAYQIYQPSIDRMIIRIVLLKDRLPTDVTAQILKEMREIVGDVMQIEFEFPQEIPLSKRGKRLFICSDVKE